MFELRRSSPENEKKLLAAINKNPLILFGKFAKGQWATVYFLIYKLDSSADHILPQLEEKVEGILKSAVAQNKYGILSSVRIDSEGKRYNVYCKN